MYKAQGSISNTWENLERKTMFLFQTKRKQITKSEGEKKKKLTQEQAQLPEPLGTDIKKDEDCLQTPPKPPPTPPSSSLNKVPLSYFNDCLFPKHITGLTTILDNLLTNPLLQRLSSFY